MIVKGHDFPNVTLVGVLAADMSLYIHDYHSAERTFQLLTQAAGRAGRGSEPGEVVIQTYTPEHYSIEAAKEQDYRMFYEQEIRYRDLLNYPPVWNLLVILISSREEENATKAAEQIEKKIAQMQLKNGLDLYSVSRLMGHVNIMITQRYLLGIKDKDIVDRGTQTSPLMNL